MLAALHRYATQMKLPAEELEMIDFGRSLRRKGVVIAKLNTRTDPWCYQPCEQTFNTTAGFLDPA